MCCGRELVPQFLCVDLIDGVGKPALKGANLPKKRNAKRKLVTRIVGVANGSKRGDENVESGKVIKGKLRFFGWYG